jgi:hypothetical protein
MTRRPPGARRRTRRAAAWIAATVLGGRALAQAAPEAPTPVGIPVGPVYIAPALTTGYAYNSNVFLNTEDLSPSPDQVLTVQPELQLSVPFSNSMFHFADTLTWVDYKETPQVAGKTSNDASADLALVFGSLDKLDLSARHIAGVAETLAFDPGGEVRFEGNAYKLHTESVAVSRDSAWARGYRCSLSRNALRFEQSINVAFFDYRGFDGEGAYLQPLSSNTRLAFGYLGARYDHYDVSPGADPSVVFRTEAGDTVYAQVEGQLGPKQPYSARVGWERLAFTGNSARDFSGLVGDVRFSAIVGGGTTFTILSQRQPYRSFFEDNNFYLYETVGGRVDRKFQGDTVVGGDFNFFRNTYAEPTTGDSGVPGILRQDRAYRLEAYANLAIGDRVLFRLSVLKNRKYSNVPGADYNAIVVFGGFILGWL